VIVNRIDIIRLLYRYNKAYNIHITYTYNIHITYKKSPYAAVTGVLPLALQYGFAHMQHFLEVRTSDHIK
jgi:hypothetical protein